jgi:phosphatidylserine decarboxylase
MSECLQRTDEFKSFNDFFCRKLQAGSRSIDLEERAIVSPADNKLFVIPNISNYVPFFVKNETFNLAKFLGSSSLASLFEGGTMMIFRLAPPDYHRFHFPIDCTAFKFEPMGNLLESVNPIVYRTGVQPLTTNVRCHYVLETSQQVPVIMTAVGAMMVGSVVETFKTDQKCLKGQEAGYFQFGGSTVTLLFQHNFVNPVKKNVDHSTEGFETAVKVGQRVADFIK